MNKGEFLRKVQAHANLPSREAAEEGSLIVFGLLSNRLTPEEAHDAQAQLPSGLKTIWPGDSGIQNMVTFSKKGQLAYKKPEELLDLVQSEIRTRQLETEPGILVEAVFHTLKEQLSDGEAEDIEGQLPAPIKELWRAA